MHKAPFEVGWLLSAYDHDHEMVHGGAIFAGLRVDVDVEVAVSAVER